jgi:hypothetical protein
MSTDNVTAITAGKAPRPSKPARARKSAAPKVPSCYDSLVSEIATLECVQATLSEWDFAGQPTGRDCRIGSAELVLRETIKRLHNLVGDVERLQSQVDGVQS